MKTPQEIVEENFKGLIDFIDDTDILDWYRSLIVMCMEQYHNQFPTTTTEVTSDYNICDPNDWRCEIGACDNHNPDEAAKKFFANKFSTGNASNYPPDHNDLMDK
jgi:hypothetical protein